MRDFLDVVARPKGAYHSLMDRGLICLTGAEPAANIGSAPVVMANPGAVYFLRAGRMLAVKIGWARDPEARLRELQTGSHHKLHLIGFVPGSREDEWEWHERFQAQRLRGEWFDLTHELRDAINTRLNDPTATRYLTLHVTTYRNAK